MENSSTQAAAAVLEPLGRVDAGLIAGLHSRLEAAADAAGSLDVAYRTIDTPVGSLLLAATERGLIRVVFERQGHDLALERLAETVSPRILKAPKRLDAVAAELDEYFAGQRTRFDLLLELRLVNGFRRSVLTHLSEIGYGRTESYAQVAHAAGSARAVRAVGTACALNPLPIVVPCHRVIRSDGSLGAYAGGPLVKQALLSLEAGGPGRYSGSARAAGREDG